MNDDLEKLEQLAAAWIKAKETESAAIERRRALDALIVAASIGNITEGTHSEEIDGFKITVTQKLNRKVDTQTLQTAWTSLTPAVQAAFKWKADVTLPAMRKLTDQDYREFAQFVSTDLATPAVKVEVI